MGEIGLTCLQNGAALHDSFTCSKPESRRTGRSSLSGRKGLLPRATGETRGVFPTGQEPRPHGQGFGKPDEGKRPTVGALAPGGPAARAPRDQGNGPARNAPDARPGRLPIQQSGRPSAGVSFWSGDRDCACGRDPETRPAFPAPARDGATRGVSTCPGGGEAPAGGGRGRWPGAVAVTPGWTRIGLALWQGRWPLPGQERRAGRKRFPPCGQQAPAPGTLSALCWKEFPVSGRQPMQPECVQQPVKGSETPWPMPKAYPPAPNCLPPQNGASSAACALRTNRATIFLIPALSKAMSSLSPSIPTTVP